MNNSNKIAQPRFLVAADKKERLSVLIPSKLSGQIADYRIFHREVSGDEATLDSLVSAFISAALTSDKSFLLWKKEHARQSAKVEPDLTETQHSEAENNLTKTGNSSADSTGTRNYYRAGELSKTQNSSAENNLLDIMAGS